ncbi:MAG: hypothetical protein AAGG65_19600 [Pseudomonadota bacterium]
MSYSYSMQGEAITLCLDPDFILVRFRSGHAGCARLRAAQSWFGGTGVAGLELPDEDVALIPTPLLQHQPTVSDVRATEETIAELRSSPNVLLAMPVFRTGHHRSFAIDRVVIGLVDAANRNAVSEGYGLHVTEVRDDKIVCTVGCGQDVFSVVAAMEGDPLVRFAEPDFVTVGQDFEAPERLAPYPSDEQWAAEELAAIMATNDRPTAMTDTDVPPFAVRFGPSGLPGGYWKTANATIARSINWARCAGADILINRWGGGPPSNDITEEFERARTSGRGGLGCVIVVASDSPADTAGFPQTLPDTLAAACDTRVDHGFDPVADSGASLPTVSGACALVLAANPSLTEAQVRHLVGRSMRWRGRSRQANGRDPDGGQSRLDIIQAVRSALAMSGRDTA